LPKNDIGHACENYLRQFGVGTEYIAHSGERLGIYFLEHGAVHRGSKVVYDRAGSAFANIQPGMIDWGGAFTGADWFHWTGITPAISAGAAATCLEAVKAAQAHGLTVSTDMNYRSKLWKWGKQPVEVMDELVSYCDVAIGNEEDAEKVFGIQAPDTDVTSGEIDAEKYRFVCQQLSERFPRLNTIAITLRSSISASHNGWSAVLWNVGQLYFGPSYDITHIVDRVGGGDSFMAGLIYGLITYGEEKQSALNFAVAASALKHTIFGDFNLVTVDEVEKIMKGNVSGRVSR
jgi:2-dehydro-3-deoxygluconokinase